MSLVKKLRLLLWKNVLLQRRRPIATALEIILPVFIVLILLIIRITTIKPKEGPIYSFHPFEINRSIPVTTYRRNWAVAYAPNKSYYNTIMQNVKNFVDLEEVVPKANKSSLEDVLVTDESANIMNQTYLCGIVFEHGKKGHSVKYNLRFPSDPRSSKNAGAFSPSKWFTDFVFPLTFQGTGPRSKKSDLGGPPPYFKDGFLTIQKAVDFAIIQTNNESFNVSNFTVAMNRYPYPKRIEDPFITVIQSSFPLLLMISLVFTAINIVKNIVYEKEKKLKESMKMMGLNGWLHWSAWFIKCFILLLLPIILITIMITVRFGSNSGKILNQSDGTLVFVFLLLYGIASIMFCFFVSSLFYRSNIAAAGGGILWFLSYVPYFSIFQYYDKLSTTVKLLTCLDFQIAMAFGANLIGRFEGQGSGVQWTNISDGVTIDDNFKFGQILGMLVLDSVLYGLLTWYLEGIFPGEYGIPKKWYFPFSKRYWCNKQDVETFPLINRIDEEEENIYNTSDFIEKEPAGLNVGISIEGLVKKFNTDSGVKVAVDGINLKMYEGQITSLLGHNGAGKTTTISMLTGLIPPTSGNAYISGYDIRNNMAAIRGSLGICPQHNVLFDNLTVEEHLWFFTSLKGNYTKYEIYSQVDRMITAIGLEEKRYFRSKGLSGGMKRKLSVGIALVGDSKIVILDEPTSGMDVSARRATWDLLQKQRRGRTMLLTTHYMDEADVLGDRIAILSNGQVKCCGSSLFLKSKYGVGYHMVMVQEAGCNAARVSQVIQKYIPTAKLESNAGFELSYVLPSECSDKFEELFTEIEETRQELKISSYGASVTTLEEVFIKVGQEASNENDTHVKLFRQLSGKDNPGYNRENTDHDSPGRLHRPLSAIFDKNTGSKLFFQRWYAMFVKRLIHSKRHKISIVSQLLMPTIFVMLALIVVKTMPKAQDSPPRTLNVDMFGNNDVPLLLHNKSWRQLNLSFRHYLTRTTASPLYVTKDSSNMTEYLLKNEKDLAQFNMHDLVALEFNASNDSTNATAWFNNEAFHSPAVAINTLSNVLLAYYTNNSKNLKITAVNYPLPTTAKDSAQDLSTDPNGFQIGFSLCFGMAFLASSFIVFLVQERSSKAKHIQFVSGVDPISYWTSAYLWDIINFVLPSIVIVILFLIFRVEAFEGARVGYILVLLILYGWAIIPVMYIFSFAFKVASTAYVRMVMVNVLTGLAMLLVVFILSIPSVNTLDVANVLKKVFLPFPNYVLGQAVINIYNNFNTMKTYDELFGSCVKAYISKSIPEPLAEKNCSVVINKQIPNYENNYLALEEPGIGYYLISLSIEGLVYFTIVLLIEISNIRISCSYRKSKNQERGNQENQENCEGTLKDGDVLEEERRIENCSYPCNEVLVLERLRKEFNTSQGKIVAVNDLSLGIPHGECFGLLGQNGAGKTTTFKILTGDETASDGHAYIENYDVSRNLAEVRQRIGYCPQFDALIDLMTGRELLVMYSRLRGVPERHIDKLVIDLAVSLGVDQYIDKCSKTYSGGNKRKLSTAIALAGDPPLIFLDEPSSGMDPVARRNLWDSLSRFIAEGKSVVITSHSMDECEALCTRLAIMVNGEFKCLGSPQHLKTKFGEGYTLIAKIGGENPDTVLLKQFIEKTFRGSILKDEHQGYVHYQLTDRSKTWANLFGYMEKAKQEYNIEDYSISQTTLEQVFLNFTRSQREVED